MCFCKEPTKGGWTHGDAYCYNSLAMDVWFRPYPSRNQATENRGAP